MTESDVVDGARSQQRGAIGLSLRSNHIREPSTCKFRRSAWISPRTCSRFTGSTRPKRSSCGNGCDGARCWSSSPPCLIGMEACATAHYWARELTKLGHRLRLMPAKDVKAYVKRNKN